MNSRPNFLILVADQLSAAAVGAFGGSFAQTPNLNRLASRSTLFDRCFSSCPLCQHARASFWTGRFPHETGVCSNAWLDTVPTVPETMPTLVDLADLPCPPGLWGRTLKPFLDGPGRAVDPHKEPPDNF